MKKTKIVTAAVVLGGALLGAYAPSALAQYQPWANEQPWAREQPWIQKQPWANEQPWAQNQPWAQQQPLAQQQHDPQRQAQACSCKAAMQELSNPRTSPQRQIQLNQWVFENCRLKNIGPEECKS